MESILGGNKVGKEEKERPIPYLKKVILALRKQKKKLLDLIFLT
ncbi:hypothetical protein H1P_3200001 [Hyella patelloides LEGE 07179]|uniref:Uncharacterized protein n=1 Tax=Hyella patelloides LEGE 07179 TaxID=945734 RepID=A0A563VV16_9CYAN|nr:hypothetical protein H1P_3200001 [Hyella patelloides LEGE 07179]